MWLGPRILNILIDPAQIFVPFELCYIELSSAGSNILRFSFLKPLVSMTEVPQVQMLKVRRSFYIYN